MTQKEELIQQAEALGLTTEGLTIDQLKESIANAEILAEEAPILNATQKRQLAAKEMRKENAKKAAKVAKALENKKADEKTASTTSKKEVKDTRQVFTDERKLKFRFKKTAPKALNIDGVSRLITDIIKDDEVMLELVNGNSNYLEQIY